MKRFMGMMPSNCIEIRKDFKDENGLKVHIDAGPKGWTIIYADGSTEYADIEATSEDNYKAAYEVVIKNFNIMQNEEMTNNITIGD